MKRPICVILTLLIVSIAQSQTLIGGTINTYSPVTLLNVCPNRLTVAEGSLFSPGNTVIIIQMKGATIDESNSASFGTVGSYNGAGKWEKAIIASIYGNELILTRNLLNNYSVSGKVQVVKVPVYTNATVTTPLTGSAWDGSTGGVIALEVTGTLVLNSTINALGIGFRGGSNAQNCPNSCSFATNANGYYYPLGNYRGASKGEGIADLISGKELGRGAQANGGGSGNDHNNGGAGGGNYSAGGLGGNNAEPGAFNCKGGNNFGRSGLGLDYSSMTRLFLGGGGGAGHGNNGNTGGCGGSGWSGAGGDGGGIVIILAGTINGNGQIINTLGENGGTSGGDGGGGGGAGGTVFLSASTYVNNLLINVRGGNGGHSENSTSNRCFGPGGGGGGGIVISNAALPVNVSSFMTGGAAGLITFSTNACNGTSGTAAQGGHTPAILSGASVPQSFAGPDLECPLPVRFIFFAAQAMGDKVKLSWATATEQDASHFSVERSSDGIHFTSIGQVTAAGNTSWRTDYSFMDVAPFPGRNYYRVRQVDITGLEKLTNIVVVDPRINTLLKNAYPNPIGRDEKLTLVFSDPEKPHYLRWTDISGKTIMQWDRPGNNLMTETLNVPAKTAGIYLLEIQTSEKKQVLKILVK